MSTRTCGVEFTVTRRYVGPLKSVPCPCGASFKEGAGIAKHQRKCKPYWDSVSPRTLTCTPEECRIANELAEAIEWATRERFRLSAAEREVDAARAALAHCEETERASIEAAAKIGLTLTDPAAIKAWKRAPREKP